MVNNLKLLQLLLLQICAWLVIAQSDIIPLNLGLDFERAYNATDILRGFKLNIEDGEVC